MDEDLRREATPKVTDIELHKPARPMVVAKDANQVRNSRALTMLMGGPLAASTAVAAPLYLATPYGAMAISILFTTFIMTFIMTFTYGLQFAVPVTKRATPGTETAIGEMLEVLTRIGHVGLRPVDRPRVQRIIDAGATSLEQVVGEKPWIAAHRVDLNHFRENRIPVEGRHPSEIATALAARMDGIALMGTTTWGVPLANAYDMLNDMLPAMVALGRAFDLDMIGLQPEKDNLPGMAGDSRLDRAASHVHELAARWREDPSDMIQPVLKLEADAAAGRDLRDLESVWMAARADLEGEELAMIDATYARSVDALEATLTSAIEARTRANGDALATHARYIDMKHGEA